VETEMNSRKGLDCVKKKVPTSQVFSYFQIQFETSHKMSALKTMLAYYKKQMP